MATLACGLAWLSFTASATWTSPVGVWMQAQRVAPGRPDPWIHGALALLDAPGDLRDARLTTAETWLHHAARAVPRQTAAEQRWAQDAMAAGLALVRMRQGRLIEASQAMQGGVRYSARWVVCQQAPSVCALAGSSGS